MAELTQGVMFREGDPKGCTAIQITALNFELKDVLGNLKPGSPEYDARAKAFHAEAARRYP